MQARNTYGYNIVMKRYMSLGVLFWLRFWARLHYKKYAPDVIGITGSAGKTSCKNAVFAILKDKYVTKVSYKANSESGLPLDILEIHPKDFTVLDWLRMCLLAPWRFLTLWKPYEKYIVEMGIDSLTPPKNMEYLLTIIRPRTAIFLNALNAHAQGFENNDPSLLANRQEEAQNNHAITQKIAAEKGKLIQSLPSNGLAILNANDGNVWAFRKKTKATVMGFSDEKASGVDVVVKKWKVTLEGTKIEFLNTSEEKDIGHLDLSGYILPEHYAQVLAAALCLALDEDFSLQEGCDLLKQHFTIPRSRSSRLEGINGSAIIDSSYSASPGPVLDMLNLLSKLPGKRKLALLGDMRELGALSRTAHESIVRKALEVCDRLYLVGPLMQDFGLPVCEAEDGQGRVRWFATAHLAGEALRAELTAGDVLLVKGSQNGIYLETTVEMVLKNKADADKLCRRGQFWNSQRLRAQKAYN